MPLKTRLDGLPEFWILALTLTHTLPSGVKKCRRCVPTKAAAAKQAPEDTNARVIYYKSLRSPPGVKLVLSEH